MELHTSGEEGNSTLRLAYSENLNFPNRRMRTWRINWGYKMVKWIERIGFVQSVKQVGNEKGGSNEDDEYFDLLPNI